MNKASKIIGKIQEGSTLDSNEVKSFFTDEASDEERKDFLLALNKRGITPEDIAGLVQFLLPQDFPKMKDAVDICGTGGSGLPRINTSTISAFILAASGAKIAKHGNRAAAGRFGSFDLLEKLGINIDLGAEELDELFQKEGLAFIFAQKFFPAMKYFMKARQELGVPTIFNLLGPLLNPAKVKNQIIGTNSSEKARLIAKAAKLIGRKHVMVIVGEDGLDEITLTGKTHCIEMKPGELTELEVSPEDFGFETVNFDKIAGGDEELNTKIALEILKGECQSEHEKLVLANCAFVLRFLGLAENYQKGVAMAKNKLENGEAFQKFQSYMNNSHERHI